MIAVEQLDPFAAGRLHADDQHVRSDDAAVPEEELSLRSDQGFHADRAGGDVVDGVRGQSEGAGEHAAGAGRLFQEPSGALRLRRHRRRAAHRGRDAQAQERRQLRPRAVSRRRAGRDRRDLGPDRDGVDGACVDARRRERPAEDSGAGRPEPASDAAGRADHGRGRTAGRAHGHLVRPGRSARHAEGDRRAHQQGACGDRRSSRRSRTSSPSSAWRWTSSRTRSSSHSWRTTPRGGGS